MKKIQYHKRKLSFLIGIYLSISGLIFSVSLLAWTYHSTDKAINNEIKKSFEQRHIIAEIIFQEKLDDIEKILKEFQSDQIFIQQLVSRDLNLIEQAFQDKINKSEDYDLDLLFLTGLDEQVRVNASSQFFDTSGIVAEINKHNKPLTGIRRIKAPAADLTTFMLEITIVKSDTGFVFGSLLGGYVLNNNFSIIDSMKTQTRSNALVLFENGDYIGASEKFDSPLITSIIKARKNTGPGEIYTGSNQLILYKPAIVSSNNSSLEIALSIKDNKSKHLTQSLIEKALVTLIMSFLFLLFSIIFIRRMTQPSLDSLLAYMENISSGDLSTPYKKGYISEFNTIGKAMENMAANLDQAEIKRKKLEDRLVRSKKMEAMGLLAGSVAHDLNNILSGIVSYPDLILMNLPEDSSLIKPMTTIKNSGERAAAVVQDLLTIARGVASPREVTDLNSLVKDYVISPECLKEKELFPGTKIQLNLDKELIPIKCSPVHITKALMNLITNAMEAIREKGEIEIKTESRYVDRPIKGYSDIKIGEYSVLCVSDNGPGISSEDIDKIFEPFYTKKKMGRSGTGLGLAIVSNTVLDHDGYVHIESRKNLTVFELYFPACRNENIQEQEQCSMEELTGNREHILVIDDDINQREIASDMLESLGYLPTAVSSGEKAVEYLKTNRADLILLDMLMPPGIDGLETYKQVIKQNPGQKAVIASGFSESRNVKEVQELGAGQYLKKPYNMEKLGLAVKQGLGK